MKSNANLQPTLCFLFPLYISYVSLEHTTQDQYQYTQETLGDNGKNVYIF